MLTKDTLVFIVDLNELEDDDLLRVSMDFTLNYGPFVFGLAEKPAVGAKVRLHSDDDDTLYYATVIEHDENGRDLVVRVHWESCAPVINDEWSAGAAYRATADADTNAAQITSQ